MGPTVYRGVSISGGWNRGIPGVSISGGWNRGVPEVPPFQGVGIGM